MLEFTEQPHEVIYETYIRHGACTGTFERFRTTGDFVQFTCFHNFMWTKSSYTEVLTTSSEIEELIICTESDTDILLHEQCTYINGYMTSKWISFRNGHECRCSCCPLDIPGKILENASFEETTHKLINEKSIRGGTRVSRCYSKRFSALGKIECEGFENRFHTPAR